MDKALGCLPTILGRLDYSTIKNEVFPVVAAVFSKTSSLGIKVRGLEAFVILCGGSAASETEIGVGLDGAVGGTNKPKRHSHAVLDKYTVQEKVVPLLKVMKTKEPAVMAAALAVFKQVGNIADSEYLATEVLPILWNFSLGPLLNLQLFRQFMDLIKKLSATIESEQIKKLQELSNSGIGKDYSKSDEIGSSNGFFPSNGTENVGANDFERLVLGRGTANGTENGTDMLSDALPQTQKMEAPTLAWSSPALNAGQNRPNTLLGITNPQSRAVTLVQGLSAFASVSPASVAIPDARPNGLSSFAPLQPSTRQPAMAVASPWTLNQAYSLPPPAQPQPVTPFSAFSLPPPPTPQRPGLQQQHSGYFGVAKTGNAGQIPAVNHLPQQQKTGLDKYESLI